MSDDGESLDEILDRLTKPEPPLALGGARSEYALVLVRPRTAPQFKDWTWKLDLPPLFLEAEADRRAFATSMRDFLIERGYDVRLIARTTIVDEVP